MFLKSCILIALTSAVKASVIINVYKENKAEHSVHDSCNYQACDQLCRWLGFPGGNCVGDRCECDNFKSNGITAENKADHSVHDSCNYQTCDQLCRRLGFPGGACVGDKCECDNFEPHGIAENKAEHSVHDSCNYQACDQLCRRLGFQGGACVGDKCKCDNFEPISIKGEALDYLLASYKRNKAINSTPRSLDKCCPLECEEICRHLDYLGCASNEDICMCQTGTELYVEVENIEQSDSEGTNNVLSSKHMLRAAVEDCEIVKCNDMSQLLCGYMFKW